MLLVDRRLQDEQGRPEGIRTAMMSVEGDTGR
jgi:hypothetical protein